jgi:oligosaccharide translocation protein RFT1
MYFISSALSFSKLHKKMIVSSLYVTGCACILELLAEPLYIVSQNLLLLKLRLIVETAATLLRCLTMYILIVKQTSMVKVYLKKQLLFCVV